MEGKGRKEGRMRRGERGRWREGGKDEERGGERGR